MLKNILLLMLIAFLFYTHTAVFAHSDQMGRLERNVNNNFQPKKNTNGSAYNLPLNIVMPKIQVPAGIQAPAKNQNKEDNEKVDLKKVYKMHQYNKLDSKTKERVAPPFPLNEKEKNVLQGIEKIESGRYYQSIKGTLEGILKNSKSKTEKD
ncbi:MAG: hypothetical protein PHU64_07695 [Candidatus Omnitrophica bacterium]|nr:hypothetical protein [Candidatus Omnitrophota bacterium]MDD5430100.1 hypothetical protein [Candidatus Omnitrophota bacterium]